jgi:HlyD family secretion protein
MASSGIAMDQPLPPRRRNYIAVAVGVSLLAAAIVGVSRLIPHGLQVSDTDFRIATTQRGLFRNDLVFRATAAPLHTLMLDVLESGRVEEVLVRDGAPVKKGQLLFRLSNPQLRLDVVARESDRAQQISNLSLLRVSMESSQTAHERRMLDLDYALLQARKQHERNVSLQQQGYIPAWTVEQSQDRLDQQRQALDAERKRFTIEMSIQRDGVRQMEQAIDRLDAGLQVVNETVESLAVRAPLDGRLTDFHLQLGEIVKPEQRIGRIDDPSEFKLTADIDEFYLGSVAVGKRGAVTANGRDHPVEISSVFPQIKEGRFSIELQFTEGQPPGMSPGQSAETHLSLGDSTPALFLPNDAWVNDTGGAWAFVVGADGKSAERRDIRIGRRNTTQVEVVAGLAAGERVIVSDYAVFGSAARLQWSH